MSSIVNNENVKGIFHWRRSATPTTSPSTSRPSSRPASRQVSPTPVTKLPPPPKSPTSSATKPPTSPRAEKTQKIKRTASDTKLLADRVSRTHVHRYLEQTKVPNDVATSPRVVESVISAMELHVMDKGTEPIESTLKKSNQVENITNLDGLSSPFKKVAVSHLVACFLHTFF